MKNKLVVIGRTGHYRCYLNIFKEEALEEGLYQALQTTK